MPRARESSPGKSAPAGFVIPMVSSENMHTSSVIQTKQAQLMNIYIYTYAYMHANNNEKRGHQFESRSMGRGWEEGKKWENLCNYLIKKEKN